MVEQSRTLSFRHAYAIGLGTMIAAGIFSLSGQATNAIGGNAVVSFLIAALIAGITASAYSEFASIYSESGGGYLFSSRVFETDLLVYAEGLMLFFGYSATTAFYLATMGHWVHEFIFLDLLGVSFPGWPVSVLVAVALGMLNARGTEESGAFQVVVTGAKVLVLIVFIGGILSAKPVDQSAAQFLMSFKGSPVDIVRIASLAFITFFGFSAIAASAGEIKNPKRTVPLSIAASIVTVTILYALVIVAMTNVPPSEAQLLTQGETAMGEVAALFLGPAGKWLIVAGAIFSMVSASNASILAASRIGYLMGREGRAFRSFQKIHSSYGTPFWSVAACTGVIVGLITVFSGIFPADGGLFGIALGTGPLTGFANVNLLIPLSIVNVALILSRRREPSLERPFRVPLATVLLVIGIVANLSLIANLPLEGIVIAAGVIVIGLATYKLTGSGSEPIEDVMDPINGEGASTIEGGIPQDDVYEVVLPVFPRTAQGEIKRGLRVADRVASSHDESRVRIAYIQPVPSQTPSDAYDKSTVQQRVAKIEQVVDEVSPVNDVVDEAFVTGNKRLTLWSVLRENDSNLLLMYSSGYDNDLIRQLQAKAPCEVMYTYGVEEDSFENITLGVGGGPNHKAATRFVNSFGANGSNVHVARVSPEIEGTPEQIETTMGLLSDVENVEIHNVEDRSVAHGLVQNASENDSVLVIGTSRDRFLKQSLFGSTPDKVLDLAAEAGVPLVVYSGEKSVSGRVEAALFSVYRTFSNIFN